MSNQTFNVGHHIFCATKKKGGINTFISSTSISQEEISEIENIASYNPPFLLPNQPSVDEIENLFPVNYAFGRLKNNANFIMHSIYTGRNNHTPDRFGNFLTHTILLDNFNNKIKVPFLFENIDFVRNINPEDEDSFILPEEIVNINGDDMSNLIEQYVTFLNLASTQLNSFLAIVDILIDDWLAKDSKNKITIMSDKESVKNLILSLYALLPAFLINKISFATYLISPDKYPFKINGIIPECGIKSLDEKFNKLIIIKEQTHYSTKYEFTEYISNLINENNLVNCIKNLDEIDILLKEFKINKFDFHINIPIKLIKIKEKVLDAKYDDLKEVLSEINDISNKEKLIEFVKLKNSNLFQTYLEKEIVSKSKNKSFEEKTELLNEFYKIYFENDHNSLKQYFYKLYNVFKESLNENEKLRISVNLLLNYPIEKFLDKYYYSLELGFVDEYFRNSIDKITFNSFSEKYNYLIVKEYPNLFKMKSRKSIEEEINKNTFFKSIDKYNDFLNEISIKERNEIFTEAISSENIISKFDLTFKKYAINIDKYFNDKKNDFWLNFFEKKKYEDIINGKHSWSYLKKQFIINNIKSEKYKEIIFRIELTENESYWLFEYFRERNEIESIKWFIENDNFKVQGVSFNIFNRLMRFIKS